MDDDTFSEVVQTLDVVCVSLLLTGSRGAVSTLGRLHAQLAVGGGSCTVVETWIDSVAEFEASMDSVTEFEASMDSATEFEASMDSGTKFEAWMDSAACFL